MLGQYKKRFLSYINKEGFDHTQGPVDPFEYHSIFLTFAKLFCVMDYEKLPLWMYISPICTGTSGVLAATICIISVGNYVRNMQVHLITECGTYLLVMGYKTLITYCVVMHRKHFHNLMRALRDDFHYIYTKGQKYRDRFFENQRLTYKASVLVAIFTASIGIGMSICACISVVIFMSSDKNQGTVRPLPFPFWLYDYDLHATPVYEILFVLSILFTFFHTYIYIFITLSQIVWVREITCKADVITWNIQDVLVGVLPAKNKEEEDYYASIIRQRMVEIITMHHSMFKLMEDYATVFKKCLMYEQKLAIPIICMTAFCFAEKYDAGEIHLIMLLLCIAVIVLVFIPSYLCTYLLEKVQSVSDACWDIPFWNAGLVLKPYLVLMMQRSMRQLPIVAAGFEDISLKTYSNILTRSYSYFNMLRQGTSFQ